MPISIQYQPQAAAVGNAAYATGAENLRRYEQAQAFQQQQLAQQAAMQSQQLAAAQARQNQQLDYNSRAAALGILADQSSQSRQYQQQQTLQDQQLQSAANLQDQRLQYGYQQQQNQLAQQAALQQQSLGAQFANQYLKGQQQYASNQQQFYNQSALNQQSYLQNLDFSKYKLDAQSQAQLNQIRQNRARLEQMRLNGEINNQQYQYADAKIKAKELGLSQTLPTQENTDLVSELNQSLVQHADTGQWFQKNPQTGAFEPIKLDQGGNKDALQQQQQEQKLQSEMANAALKMYSDQMKLREGPGSPKPDMNEIMQVVRGFYGQGSAGDTPGMGLQVQQGPSGITPGLQSVVDQWKRLSADNSGNPTMSDQEILKLAMPMYYSQLPRVTSDGEWAALPAGSEYVDKNGKMRVKQ